MLRIYEDLITQAVELTVPSSTDLSYVNHRVIGIFAQPLVQLLIPENCDSPFNALQKVDLVMCLEVKPIPDKLTLVELQDCITQPSGFERDYRRGPNKELVLDNPTWFKQRWHKAEVSAQVYGRTVRKEFIWRCPEAVRELSG
jgi:hypothetical protein